MSKAGQFKKKGCVTNMSLFLTQFLWALVFEIDRCKQVGVKKQQRLHPLDVLFPTVFSLNQLRKLVSSPLLQQQQQNALDIANLRRLFGQKLDLQNAFQQRLNRVTLSTNQKHQLQKFISNQKNLSEPLKKQFVEHLGATAQAQPTNNKNRGNLQQLLDEAETLHKQIQDAARSQLTSHSNSLRQIESILTSLRQSKGKNNFTVSQNDASREALKNVRNQVLLDQYNALCTKSVENEARCKALQDNLKRDADRLVKTKQKLEATVDNKAAKERQNASTLIEMEKLRVERAKHDNEMVQIIDQMARLNQKIQKMDRWQRSCDANVESIGYNLKDEIETARQQKVSAIETAKEQLLTMQQQLDDLDTELEQKYSERCAKEQEMTQLLQEQLALSSRLDRQENQLNQSRQNLEKMEEDNGRLQLQRTQLLEQNVALKNQLDNLQKTLTDVQSAKVPVKDVSVVEKSSNTAKINLAQIDALNEQLRATQNTNALQRQQLERQKQQTTALRRLVEQYEKDSLLARIEVDECQSDAKKRAAAIEQTNEALENVRRENVLLRAARDNAERDAAECAKIGKQLLKQLESE